MRNKYFIIAIIVINFILVLSPIYLDEGEYIQGAKHFLSTGKLYGGTVVINGIEVPYVQDMPHPPGLILLLSLFLFLHIPFILQRILFLVVAFIGAYYISLFINEERKFEIFALLTISFPFVFSSSSLMTDMPAATLAWISLYMLKKERFLSFSFFFAVALFFRHSIILFIPFILLYAGWKIFPYLLLSFIPSGIFLIYSSMVLNASQMSLILDWSGENDNIYFIRRLGYYSVILIFSIPALLIYFYKYIDKWKKILFMIIVSGMYALITKQLLTSVFVGIVCLIILNIFEKEFKIGILVLSAFVMSLFGFPMGSLRYLLPIIPFLFIIDKDAISYKVFINGFVSILFAISLLIYNTNIKDLFKQITDTNIPVYTLTGWGGYFYAKNNGMKEFVYKSLMDNQVVFEDTYLLIKPEIAIKHTIPDSFLYNTYPIEWYKINSLYGVSPLPFMSSLWGRYPFYHRYIDRIILLQKPVANNSIYKYFPKWVSFPSMTNYNEFIFYNNKIYKGIFAHAPDTIVYEKIKGETLSVIAYLYPQTKGDGVQFEINVDDTVYIKRILNKTDYYFPIKMFIGKGTHDIIFITNPLHNNLYDWSVWLNPKVY